MDRRTVLKGLGFGALLTPLLPQTLATAEQLVRLPTGEELALVRPGTYTGTKPIFIRAVSGAVLETDHGPIRLGRHEFSALMFSPNSHLDLTWRVSFPGLVEQAGQRIGEGAWPPGIQS